MDIGVWCVKCQKFGIWHTWCGCFYNLGGEECSNSSGKEKDSRLHFYFHNTLSGKNPSAVELAEASTTKKLPNLFGLLNIFDDPLTEGPEPISMLVDPAQGLYGFAGQQEL